ncbi:hypothetical protein GGTG_07670 [Gaeumannomyces tritici R3-111a-1]|uniref:Uncharacterized protein n=1 Tax=Gaeumannomyces tritici (strain R3-111a-1) TaxID=644352 RepID=J3P2C3_GAET3|nr:hypothetical protein GGTG_07670 [Gaeumannomyces tritici R3-111a-1]EJT73815.1 hypothetical protein GGTG_07670 [Gaeumannomyces tritici R3-111a-1]
MSGEIQAEPTEEPEREGAAQTWTHDTKQAHPQPTPAAGAEAASGLELESVRNATEMPSPRGKPGAWGVKASCRVNAFGWPGRLQRSKGSPVDRIGHASNFAMLPLSNAIRARAVAVSDAPRGCRSLVAATACSIHQPHPFCRHDNNAGPAELPKRLPPRAGTTLPQTSTVASLNSSLSMGTHGRNGVSAW